MRSALTTLAFLAAASGPSAAADLGERSSGVRYEERLTVSPETRRYYGPQVRVNDVAEQVVVRRGPRILLEDDSSELLRPVYVYRRLPQAITTVPVEADVPLFERRLVAIRDPRSRRARR